MKKLWTIAVLTIPERKQLLERLMARLKPQLNDQVELKIYPDTIATVGAKRQKALDECKTSYINFIDDDDLVPAYYVSKLLDKLKYLPDGVGFRGIITSNNIKPVEFVHRAGLKYIDKVFRSSDCYIFHRPLNHLNPVKTEIAQQIGFKDWWTFSDKDYSVRMAESGLITDDIFIDEFLYFYQYRSKNVKVQYLCTMAKSYNDYPQSVIDAAKRGIRLNDEVGNKCATQVGKIRAQQLANGEAITILTVKRMYSYLSRAAEYYNPNDDQACGTISYLLWGGEPALRWAERILKQEEEI